MSMEVCILDSFIAHRATGIGMDMELIIVTAAVNVIGFRPSKRSFANCIS